MALVKTLLSVLLFLIFMTSLETRANPYKDGINIKEIDPNEVLYADLLKELSIEKPKTRMQWEEVKKAYSKRFSEVEIPKGCQAAQEYQSAFEYLQNQKLLILPDMINVKLAFRVSEGCNGAAARFKKIVNLLIPAGVDRKKTLLLALHFARRNETQANAFVLMFKGTFLDRYWDLDFKSSLATSFQVAFNARGNPEAVATDFRQVMDYCLTQKTINQPIKTCAPYALDLAQSSYLWKDGGLSSDFKEMMDFLQTQKELDPSAVFHLKMAAQILSQGPLGVKNFKSQYTYALSPKMGLPQKAAFELALKVSQNSLNDNQDWLELQ